MDQTKYCMPKQVFLGTCNIQKHPNMMTCHSAWMGYSCILPIIIFRLAWEGWTKTNWLICFSCFTLPMCLGTYIWQHLGIQPPTSRLNWIHWSLLATESSDMETWCILASFMISLIQSAYKVLVHVGVPSLNSAQEQSHLYAKLQAALDSCFVCMHARFAHHEEPSS